MRAYNSLLTLVPIAYSKVVNGKIKELTVEHESAIRNIKLYEKLVLKNEHNIYDTSVINLIRRTNGGKYDIEELNKIYEKLSVNITNRLNPENTKNIVRNFSKIDDKIILTYLLKLKKYIILEASLYNRIRKYKQLNFSEETIRYVVKSMFKHISYKILLNRDGVILPLGIKLRIIGKSLSRKVKLYNNTKLRPDWGESFKTLLAIANEDAHDIYVKYNKGEIKKKEFVEHMKPYVYSKDNPNGKKWIVYQSRDLNFWLVFTIHNKNSNLFDKYSIVPANGVSIPAGSNIPRKQSEVIKLMKSVDDIIYTKYLQFRDKIAMIEKFDIEYCKRTFNYNMD